MAHKSIGLRVRGAGRMILGATAVIVGLGMTGCVNQGQYDKLHAANRALEERNVALQQDVASKDQSIALLKQRIGEGDATVGTAQGRNAELNSELVRLRESYRQLAERLNNASISALDPEVDRALRALASRHPNLVTYDATRGMVEFRSDLTFASGSADVRADAEPTLQQLAQIVASAPAANYDLRIVGHTDNVPVSKPATLQAHRTNMHLSAHRAISVRDKLKGMGVAEDRIEVAGWGPWRPKVANPDRGGAEQNRRVEIFFVPSSRDTSIPTSPETAPPPAPTAQVDDTPMK